MTRITSFSEPFDCYVDHVVGFIEGGDPCINSRAPAHDVPVVTEHRGGKLIRSAYCAECKKRVNVERAP